MDTQLIRLLNNLLEKGQFTNSEEKELIYIIEQQLLKESK